jgi:hypothetical protein
MVLTTDYTDKKFMNEDHGSRVRQVLVDAIHVSILIAYFVISSEAEGAVENGAAWEAATRAGRPKAERMGDERIKSLDFICLVTHRHQDPPDVRSRDQSGRFSSLATTSSAVILELSHRERRDKARSR